MLACLHLDIGRLDEPAGLSGGNEVCEGDEGGDDECDGGEEAKGVLHPDQRAVHGGQLSLA